jgi:UDP-N-acetylmuramoyl-tripeptide--D-alanyl-D-alanine ligase
VAARVAGLSSIENRIGVIRAPSGVVIIDDTFNSNPAGAAAALSVLSRLEVPGRKVVVTPGMIELGAQQDLENEKFAMRSGEIADVVVCVQRTNLRSLRRGLSKHPTTEVLEVATRDDAVRWVRESLGDGDAVLYENDLPDNYP